MKKNCSTRNSSLVSTSTRPRLLRKKARPINKRKHLYRISSSNITNNMFLCQVNKDSRPDSSRTAFKCHSKLSRVSFKTTREHLIFYQGLEILKMNCSNLVIHYLFRVLTHNPVKWIQMWWLALLYLTTTINPRQLSLSSSIQMTLLSAARVSKVPSSQ